MSFMWITMITLLLGQLIFASSLIPRQLSAPLDVPPACNNNCTQLNTILQSCVSVSCFCTEILLEDYASCFICLGGLTGASLDTPQQILNGIVTDCQQDGVNLTPVILPGEPSFAAEPISAPQSSPPLLSSSGASISFATSSSPPIPSSSASSSTTSTTSSTSSLTPSSQQSSSSIQTPNAVIPSSTQSSNSTSPSTVTVSPSVASDTSGSKRITVSVAAGVTAISLVLCFLY